MILSLNYRFTLLAGWRNALKWSRFINQYIFLANGNSEILLYFMTFDVDPLFEFALNSW